METEKRKKKEFDEIIADAGEETNNDSQGNWSKGINMLELDNILDLYMNSGFYEKNKNTYHSDKILKYVFRCEIRVHKFDGLSKKTYEEIHQIDTEFMRDLICEFANKVDEVIVYKMILACYIDPDCNAKKTIENIQCSADALFSVKRIFNRYGISEEAVTEYEYYRKKPIFFFPIEKNGINMARYSVFGDRIDYTLYDLKMYFKNKEKGDIKDCKLFSAYKRRRTKKWLDKIESFSNLVKEYSIEGVFVNENFEVYDIEKGNGEIISNYAESYSRQWSNRYYDNLRKLVDKYFLAGSKI